MKHPIPAEALKRHTAILGMTGSGKSSTGRLMVEEVVELGHRVCILDTIKSDWWGITSSRSGKSPGLPFKILGGPRGHLPLHSSTGKPIGQLVGSGKLPLSIIDMADFEPGGLQRFFVDFVPALMRSMKGVVYLVIEEAHEVAPKERAGFGAENMAIHFAKKLGTGGRTKGIRLIVATQRVQSLHNAVLGSCETVIAHRIGFADDQVPVLKWMKAKIGKENAATVEAELANLPDGVGFLASGAPVKIFERVKFPLFSTYDNTATPEHDDAQLDIKTAPVNADELRAIIGDAVAEAESNDPVKLKAQIATLTADKARLERQAQTATAAPASAVDPQVIEQARRAGFKAGFDEAVNQSSRQVDVIKTLVARVALDVETATEAIAAQELKFVIGKNDIQESGSLQTPAKAATTPRPAQLAAPAARKPSPAASGDGSLSNPQRQLLKALAWWSQMGHDNPSRPQVAAIAGWKVTAGHLRNVVGSLNANGMTFSKDGHIALTAAGIAAAPEPDMGVTLIDGLRGILTNPQKQIFECLLSKRRAMSRTDIASTVGWDANAGHLRNVVGSMRTLEIIDYPSNGMVELQSWVLG